MHMRRAVIKHGGGGRCGVAGCCVTGVAVAAVADVEILLVSESRTVSLDRCRRQATVTDATERRSLGRHGNRPANCGTPWQTGRDSRNKTLR